MAIQFAAVHEENGWRQHSQHKTLDAATSGKDGAVNLLLNLHRAPAMHERHGPARAVVVWDEDASHAHAFRLSPKGSTEVERVRIPVEWVCDFKTHAGPSPSQIDTWFAENALAVDVGSLQEQLTEASGQTQPRGRKYRYGDKPTWEVVLDAVMEIGRPVTSAEVGQLIATRIPDFAKANIGPDLSVLSVNCFSRGNHAVNTRPRSTDTGNQYDRLIRIGKGAGVFFELYDPGVHGVWALVDVGDKVLRPRYVRGAEVSELQRARDAAMEEGLFDTSLDARLKALATIVQREGQPAFRKALLKAYGGACAITGCSVEQLLEAAHVMPYRGQHTNHAGNGLLLRTDVHKLFDLHLICIEPGTRVVRVCEALKISEYGRLDGVILRMPSDSRHVVLDEALREHMRRCGWTNAGVEGEPL
ncbi:HNH endonuclease [Hydrogenophaga sp. BPS33]|uniref:HNH endonuclease n=1 Tax=Hydrogenophaga sp. BPS33 TaxID=2651974 RepID=UPI00135B9C16|nr:HNH endonuclease signature motif containing protein [Hydrogenophaga sp. BPS33]